MTDIYWTYEIDGVRADLELLSKQEAQATADEKFAQQCVDNGARHGQEFQEDVTLICFRYDVNGIGYEVSRRKSVVEYTHYNEFKEHNTHHRGGSI